ncbi:unnamed protein product [Gadus morhua 'NCC']
MASKPPGSMTTLSGIRPAARHCVLTGTEPLNPPDKFMADATKVIVEEEEVAVVVVVVDGEGDRVCNPPA